MNQDLFRVFRERLLTWFVCITDTYYILIALSTVNIQYCILIYNIDAREADHRGQKEIYPEFPVISIPGSSDVFLALYIVEEERIAGTFLFLRPKRHKTDWLQIKLPKMEAYHNFKSEKIDTRGGNNNTIKSVRNVSTYTNDPKRNSDQSCTFVLKAKDSNSDPVTALQLLA